ncbi:MAG: hypothetical protein HY037_03355, partial [Nitrospirae bacterium]|nr:hypothetical protein [Candidatus Troglogloeales bacterium]
MPQGSSGGTVLPDLFTGTMSYSIPIEVPMGRKGMDPGLALTYKSSGGNGVVGMGWEMEVGAVERSRKDGVDYGGDDYVLRLAGATVDLVRTSGTAPGDGEFRAKIEGAFSRVKKTGSVWEVTDKTGTRYLFGQTAASRQDGTPGIFKWSLDQVIDPNDNSITLSYLKDQGQIYLDRIDYTYPGPTNYVKFYYESRTDAPVMYTTNFAVTTAKRLKTIDVMANGLRQRAYELSYTYSTSTGRSILASVQQFGRDSLVDVNGTVTGGTALPAMSFGYTSGGNSFNSPVSGPTRWVNNSIGGASIDISRVKLGDFNGDGKTDIAAVEGWGSSQPMSIYLSKGDGTFAAAVSGPTRW